MSHCHALCNVTSSVSSPSLSGNKPPRNGFCRVGSEQWEDGKNSEAASLPTQLLPAVLPKAGKESTARRRPRLGLRHSQRRSRATADPRWAPRPPHPRRTQGLLSELGPSACPPEGSAQDLPQQRVRTSLPPPRRQRRAAHLQSWLLLSVREVLPGRGGLSNITPSIYTRR